MNNDIEGEKKMKHWWNGYPWRMIQTNLREIDMDDIDAAKYVRDLKNFGATVVTLNAAGIIASYKSKLPYHPLSKYLHGDSLYRIVEECHKKDIKVIARTDFSKIRQSVYEDHPDWAYRTREGKIVNYNGNVHTCPNGDYQQKFMFEILEEVLTTHPFDGVFFNMSGFLVVDYSGKYHGPCHCENCQRKFKEKFGMDLPLKDDPRDPVYKKYILFKKESEIEHTERLHHLIKEINPEIAIHGLDYIRSESNTEIGRPQWQYSASSNSRVTSGPLRNRPVDNASVDFMGFRYRYTSVSPALMALRQWQNLANSGNLSIYIMGRLDNHPDISSYEPTMEVFSFHQKNETLLGNLVSKAKVAVIRKSKYERDFETFGWIRALTESHIPFDEIRLSELNDLSQINNREVVILGDMKFLSDDQAGIFDDFAAGGGTVIATGETGLCNEMYEERKEMALKCLGVESIKEVKRGLMSSIFQISDEEKKDFPRCKETPFISPGADIVIVKADSKTEQYLKLIPEHSFGPPELCYFDDVSDEPGVLVSQYQNGKGVYIPWKAGDFYRQEGYQNTLNIMQDILFSVCGMEEIAPDLSPMVELTYCGKDNKQVIQLVNNSGCFANSYFNPLPIRDITLRLKDDNKITNIESLRRGGVQSRHQDGFLIIELDELKDYEALVLS